MKSRSSGATINPRRPASLTNFCCLRSSSAWPTGWRDTASFAATDSCVSRSPGASRRSQIAHFFEHYKDLEAGKWVRLAGWVGPEEAKREIVESVDRYRGAHAQA
jgi:hypothetical protein